MHRLKIVRDCGAVDAAMLPIIPRRGDWIIYDSESGISWLAKVSAVALWQPDPYSQWEAIVRVTDAKTCRGANEAEKAWLCAIEEPGTHPKPGLIPDFPQRNASQTSPITPIDKFLNMRIDGDKDGND